VSIEKRDKGDGYNVRWRDSQGRQRSRKVTLWRDAVALDGEMKRKKAMGELIVHERGTVKLEDFWLLWLERYGRVHVTARTLDGYERLWRKHVAPALGRARMRDISAEDVAHLVAALSGRLAAGSVRKVLAILQGVLQRAVEWQYIPTNPCAGTRKPRLAPREGIALDEEQLAALIEELPDLRSKLLVRLLAATGLRPGELRALTWGDVLNRRDITVTKAVSKSQVGPTKTYGRRAVVLRDEAYRALLEWQLASGARGRIDSQLVFPSVSGRGVWTDEGWRMWQRKVFTKAAARAGFAGLVPYDMRHTFASRLIAEGRDIYWIARQLGHSPTQTLNTYGHLFESRYSGSTGGLEEVPGVVGDGGQRGTVGRRAEH
jgi:integrase